MEEYINFWKNYVNFSGRSTRREFWLPVLFNFVISGVLAIISTALGEVFALIVLIPNIANQIRRMHDINKSGWNLLLALIPLVGWIIVLVYFCRPTVDEGNMYGTEENIVATVEHDDNSDIQ